VLETLRRGQRWLTGLFVLMVGGVFIFFIGLGGPLRGRRDSTLVQVGPYEYGLDVFERVRPQFPALRLVLAPRHPERAAEVERLILERGLRPVRRTALGPGGAARGATIILDTVGELADLYRLAAVVFVGGSLVPAGGHNMLEPVLRKKPVLYGPHATNFRDSAALLESVGAAVVVTDTGDLERQMTRLLRHPDTRREMGEAGFAAVVARQGAVAQTLALVERVLVDGHAPRGS